MAVLTVVVGGLGATDRAEIHADEVPQQSGRVGIRPPL